MFYFILEINETKIINYPQEISKKICTQIKTIRIDKFLYYYVDFYIKLKSIIKINR